MALHGQGEGLLILVLLPGEYAFYPLEDLAVLPDLVVQLLRLEERVADKALEHAHERPGVLAQDGEGHLAAGAEDAVVPGEAHAVDEVAGEAEGDPLRELQREALPEDARVVDVHRVAGLGVEQDVFKVAISKPVWIKCEI